MFEFVKIEDRKKAARMLEANLWLKKFVRMYMKDDSEILDEGVVRSGFKIPAGVPLEKGVVEFVGRTRNYERFPPVDSSYTQSFQNLIYIVRKMKSNINKQHKVLAPFLLSLSDSDIDLFIKLMRREITIPSVYGEIIKEEGYNAR